MKKMDRPTMQHHLILSTKSEFTNKLKAHVEKHGGQWNNEHDSGKITDKNGSTHHYGAHYGSNYDQYTYNHIKDGHKVDW